jgi:hypothetical protein
MNGEFLSEIKGGSMVVGSGGPRSVSEVFSGEEGFYCVSQWNTRGLAGPICGVWVRGSRVCYPTSGRGVSAHGRASWAFCALGQDEATEVTGGVL